jgi:hypothetical protein
MNFSQYKNNLQKIKWLLPFAKRNLKTHNCVTLRALGENSTGVDSSNADHK